MKRTSSFVYDIVIVIGVIIFLFVTALLLFGEQTLPDERTYTPLKMENYSDGWKRVMSYGTKSDIAIPGQYQPEEEAPFVIEKSIDGITRDNAYVSFNTAKQDIEVYVGDELRYSYSTKNTRLFGENSPGIATFVPLYPEDNGQTLKIEFIGNNNYSGVLGEITIGPQAAIFRMVFDGERYVLLLTLFLLVLGIIAFIIGISVKLAYNKTLPLFFAGWVIICASIWSLAESNCRQFFVPNYSLLSYMTYLSLIMLSFTMGLYFDRLQEGRYRIFYMIMGVLDMFVAGLGILLQFVNNTDLSGILIYAFISLVITMGGYIATVIPDIIQGRVKEYIMEFIGIVGAMVAGLIQIYVYEIDKPMTMNGLILMLGLLFLIVMSYLRALRDIRNMERNIFAAVQAQDASTAFLTRMSHEMRTPINAILGMNKMILRESREEKILDYARDVNGAGNYLLGIVNEVLDLAKVTAGKIEIVPDDYDLIEMVRECYSMVRPRAKANRLSFEVDMSDVLPAKLRGDKERIIQVITNLLTNAIKYTPSGRVCLSIQGNISGGRLMLKIMVSDTGIGIAKENIPYLFDSFNRVGEFKNYKIEGTGLGLTITKQLIDLMGGEISVESEVGKGTTFTVVIPQEIRTVEPCGIFSMGPNGDRRVADRSEIFDVIGRILVVDDVAINLRVFTMLLSNTDIVVDTAISGAEALEKIKRTKYDLIFIDHLMPGMDGLELKDIMGRMDDNLNKDTPLIMQTANAIVGAKEKYEAMGFADYIAKPIKEEELRKLLREYMI
ncbi:hypothetical protein CSX00_07805 [Pseudobutyrivibrio ruminis]|uniref:Circadian input-output histidine kinase CikA n=1 Tax=Pseudobutyrivibrio ruminis TaxID=46206 RepID=A0A2G3E9C8_9FIRM|nr:ATP-binding protein [Pseudobutyrivibrio ruminis]PHU39810.1 hypothetical protein CSX00_07805 [Pseudobutyrivibrio ruminis]